MKIIQATIKAPLAEVKRLKNELSALGVSEISVRNVPYERFIKESRLNYDCVFGQMWEEESEAAYLDFCFEDSAQGRKAAYDIEFNLKQIPLNLRYTESDLGRRNKI